MLCKGHRKAGGVIRLWPDDEVTDGLAVAEGIETEGLLSLRERGAAIVFAGVGRATAGAEREGDEHGGQQRAWRW